MAEDKLTRVRRVLLAERDARYGDGIEWPFLTGLEINKRQANKFMLGAIIDFQVPANEAWESARRFAEDDLDDPLDLWETIIETWTESEWSSRDAWKSIQLHRRFHWAHNRIRVIAVDIMNEHDGDCLKIWQGQTPKTVLSRLGELGRNGVGEQLARMIVGALIDTGQIDGTGEFKADTHVRTVLGRVMDGHKVSEHRALEIGEQLVPGDSWQLDGLLFWHGKDTCKRNPKCGDCFLAPDCAYFANAAVRT